jgi:hypothetical protein
MAVTSRPLRVRPAFYFLVHGKYKASRGVQYRALMIEGCPRHHFRNTGMESRYMNQMFSYAWLQCTWTVRVYSCLEKEGGVCRYSPKRQCPIAYCSYHRKRAICFESLSWLRRDPSVSDTSYGLMYIVVLHNSRERNVRVSLF